MINLKIIYIIIKKNKEEIKKNNKTEKKGWKKKKEFGLKTKMSLVAVDMKCWTP